jgi:hypothetical protein
VGEPGGDCGPGNTCTRGGCYVFGECRANGAACGSGPNGDVVPGMCSNGSCVNAGATCGNVDQPCCGDKGLCTAPRAGCVMGKGCQACGGMGQPCCDFGPCVAGLSCQGGGGGSGRVGSCLPCGQEGQACCGTGAASQKTCNGGLSCRFGAGAGDRCAK